jgi:2-succinyl-6-hydroxy-2,4-cyclohexadiene-1-carboxylate synthase
MTSMRLSEEPPVVLLHGFLGDRRDWDEVVSLLAPRRVHAIELPGHGCEVDARVADPDDAVRWLAGRLGALRLPRYRLVGYSMGGRLALMFAKAAHNRASETPPCSVVVESAHPGLCEDPERAQRKVHDVSWASRFESEPIRQVLDDWYRQPVFSDQSKAARERLVTRRSCVHGPSVARTLRALSLAGQPDLQPWLVQSGARIGWITGGSDTRYSGIVGRLRGHIPTLYWDSLPGGHNVHLEAPAVFVESLIRGWKCLEAGVDV